MLLDVTPILSVNSPVFPIVISCAAIFVTVYFNNRKIKIDMNRDNENKLGKKANMSYVQEKNIELEKRISDTDAAVDAMKLSNSNQHKDLFNKIAEVGAGVARIEGYLSAKKEN